MKKISPNKNIMKILKNGGHLYIEDTTGKIYLYTNLDERVQTVRRDTFKKHFLKLCYIKTKDEYGRVYMLKVFQDKKMLYEFLNYTKKC